MTISETVTKRRGRPPIHGTAMTGRDRVARYRQRRKLEAEANAPCWSTPADLIAEVLAAEGRDEFDLDVASPAVPTVPCKRWFTAIDDGLKQEWHGDLIWMNPPYECLKSWVLKALAEWQAGRAKRVVMLLRLQTISTLYWGTLPQDRIEMRVLQGRLRFGNGKYKAPWPCVIATLE